MNVFFIAALKQKRHFLIEFLHAICTKKGRTAKEQIVVVIVIVVIVVVKLWRSQEVGELM